MPRYVDVENISKLFNEKYNETKKLISDGDYFLDNLAEGFTEADRIIRAMPTADVVEVVHSEWHTEVVRMNSVIATCRNCHRTEEIHITNCFEYCPHCGAKMDRKEDGNGKTNM